MECPKCATENGIHASRCGKCDTPLPGTDSPETLNDSTKAWSAAVTPQTAGKMAGSRGDIETGTVLANRYEILALLGQGGMGAVYKAHDKELERTVALKLIRADLASNPEILRRFKQELILARQVTHKNVIRIFDLGQSEGIKFISMDFVEGQDLRVLLLERGKFPAEQAARLMLQICRALEAAHAEGVIHRDLKPQNIMVTPDGRVYVMDFGIARSAYLPGMTQTGALIGTPEYMSPEQARGEKLTERSDLFSLGVIFYELLTAKSPYPSDAALGTLWKRLQEKPKSPTEVDASVPKALSDMVMSALEIEPEKRMASAREMARQLEIWLGPSAGSSTIILPAPRTAPYWKWASAALAILLVGAVIAFRLKGPGKPKTAQAPISVLVGDFANETGNSVFDGTLEPMFNVALEGASFINAFNRGDARREAGKLAGASGKLDEQTSRLVAVSQGVSAIVTGSLRSRGDGYELSAHVVDAVTGKTLASADVRAANKDEVLSDVPKLVAPIRKALGDTTPESVQLSRAQGSFTANNLEAVHQYGIAMEEQFAGKMQEALQSFSKAAELDPNFARAYSGMSATYGNLGRTSEAEKYAKLAIQHIDSMTERERYRLRGLYYLGGGKWQKCVEEYSELVKKYPGDNIGHSNLAVCYSQQRDWSKAVAEAQEHVNIHPDAAGLGNLALFSSYASDFQTGERAARRLQQLMPSFEYGYLSLAFAQTGQGQLQQATETYQKLQNVSVLGASMAASGLADLDLQQGRFTEAIRILEQGAAADMAAKGSDSAADKYAAMAYAQLSKGQKREAVAAAEKALAASQGVKIRFLAALTFVEAGETSKAQKLSAGLASDIQPEPQAYAKIIDGQVALKRGDRGPAIKAFTEANSLLDTWIGRFVLGRAYVEAGEFAEATSELDRCLARRGETLALFLDESPTYGYFPPTYYYLGRAEEGLSSSGAANSYFKFVSLQEKGDESALLQDAKKRLAELTPNR
ncbi:MAG TPA: protein kinase [Candidatus Acidoferrum sp.]|nr:protein kinase [Candidatus Acidoferrum sp.]